MPDIHLTHAPSGAVRWINCPGSINHDIPNKTSDAAEEGTAAHALMEDCFLLDDDPFSRLGEVINGYEVTEEMASGVQLMLDTILAETIKLKNQYPDEDVTVEIEEFVRCKDYESFGGTIDCRVHCASQVTVVDFKYGRMPVHAYNNAQLMCYGLLSMNDGELGQEPDRTLRVVIVQPRSSENPEGPLDWDVPPDRLDEFRRKAIIAIEKGPKEEFVPGDHCTWCPRSKETECPELYQLTISGFEEAFKLDESPEEGVELMTVAGRQAQLDRIADVLEVGKAVTKFIENARSKAHELMELGEHIRGHKLVDSLSNRTYCVAEDAILRRCNKLGFKKKDVTETSLLSPARLEKVIGKEAVNKMVTRHVKGTSVVPESDRKPAVVRSNPDSLYGNFED